jgi:hypothetical protein
MTHPHNETEARIDQVLHALRDTQPSPDLNARIADRIAEHRLSITESRTSSSSLFAVILNGVKEAKTVAAAFFAVILNAVKDPRILFAEAPLYIVAGTVLTMLLAITTIALHHRTPPAAAQSKPIPIQPHTPPQPFTGTQTSGTQASGTQPSGTQARGLGNTQVAQGFSLGSPTTNQRAGVSTPAPSQQPTDPDTIALAETLAPSHPAPPMPLTQQEKLLLRVARTDNPQVLAMLNPTLRAQQEAKEKEEFEEFAGISNTPHRIEPDRN